MPETLEAFVSKLQADGVRAGQMAADKIRAEAEEQAKQVIAEAEARAEQLLASAEAKREKIEARAATELHLAARDTIVRLQGSLNRAMRDILTRAAQRELTDPEFFAKLLREVVMEYVKADIEGRETMTINIPESMHHQLVDYGVGTLVENAGKGGLGVVLDKNLKADGFEYTLVDGTVEVTLESVVEVLAGIVGPELKNIVFHAATDDH
ncbi:MAG: hypothetical protein JXB13_21985 [Phycisphaerae bacterium]|nr:hypothetical protein [Phycisphaerae bacterium]